MAVLRFIASILLLIAVIAFVSDATKPMTGTGNFVPTTIAKQWHDLAPGSMQAAKVAVGRATSPVVWDTVIVALINTPVFLLFGFLAAMAGYAGRRRNTVNIFVN